MRSRRGQVADAATDQDLRALAIECHDARACEHRSVGHFIEHAQEDSNIIAHDACAQCRIAIPPCNGRIHCTRSVRTLVNNATEEIICTREWICETREVEVSDDRDINAESILLVDLRRDDGGFHDNLRRRRIDFLEQFLDCRKIFREVAHHQHSLKRPTVGAAVARAWLKALFDITHKRHLACFRENRRDEFASVLGVEMLKREVAAHLLHARLHESVPLFVREDVDEVA